LAAGTYYWRITVPAADGSRFSTPPRRFNVTAATRVSLDYPIENVVLDGARSLRSPEELRWSSSEPILRSRLVLSSNPNPLSPDAVLLLDITNGGRAVRLPRLGEGTYYWTVQAQSAGGVNISPAAPAVFRIGPVPLLPPVTLRSPENNYAFMAEMLRENRTIPFSWTAPSGEGAIGGGSAINYILSIYRAADTRRASPVFRSQPLSRTSYVFENLALLDAGNFIWSVEPVAVSETGSIEQRGTVREATFRINIKIPDSPKLSDERTYGN
jgi:hypothetical protein